MTEGQPLPTSHGEDVYRRIYRRRSRSRSRRLSGLVVAADEVTNGKPHPEPYLKGAELLGVSPLECLVIEDAPAGIRAAQAGGMKVIALTSTYPASALSEADVVVEKLANIQVAPDGAQKLMVSAS